MIVIGFEFLNGQHEVDEFKQAMKLAVIIICFVCQIYCSALAIIEVQNGVEKQEKTSSPLKKIKYFSSNDHDFNAVSAKQVIFS